MTAHPTLRENRRKQTTVCGEEHQDVLLTALGDRDCRRILRETAEETLTANELSAQLELPLSTTYRKIELLCETSLITQTCRLVDGGHHATQYRCDFGQIHISLSVSDEALLSVIHTEEGDRNTNG